MLIGFIETLQTLPLSPQSDRYLGMMSQQASRMQSVVQDLLTLSRLEGSPLPGMTEWTPVQALMQRCEDEARGLSALLTQSQARPHVLEFPPAEQLRALGEIAGVPTELQSALSNLISNALATHLRVAPSPWPGSGPMTERCGFPCATRARASRQSTFRV